MTDLFLEQRDPNTHTKEWDAWAGKRCIQETQNTIGPYDAAPYQSK